MAKVGGWRRLPNAVSGTEALGLNLLGTYDTPLQANPNSATYVFGTGTTDAGRISTRTRAGSAITIPDAYSFGEMWELRFTFAETGNSQRQGLFMEVRTSAANTSTIRGMEVNAAQEGAIAVGVLEGANFAATTRSTGTGNITAMYGLTGEFKHNSDAYTGTITDAAAVRAKFSFEDGATYTKASIFRAEIEPVSGGGAINSILWAENNDGSASTTVNYLIDTSGLESTNYSANRVVLWKFKGANGTDYFVVHDVDSATSLVVDTNETE